MTNQIDIKFRDREDDTDLDNISNSNDIIDWKELTADITAGSSTSYLNFRVVDDDGDLPNGNDEAHLWDGNSKIFGGIVTKITKNVDGTEVFYDIECSDWKTELDKNQITESYSNETVEYIIGDIISKYASDFDATNVDCTENVNNIKFEKLPITKAIEQLADRVTGYNWYVDPEKNIHFFEKGTNNAPATLKDDNNTALKDGFRVTEDFQQIVNKVKVVIPNLDEEEYIDQTSIDNYGEYQRVLSDTSLTSNEEAESVAQGILDKHKNPRNKISFGTYESGFYPGQTLSVNLQIVDEAGDYEIQKVVFRTFSPKEFEYRVEAKEFRDKDLVDYISDERQKPTPDLDDDFGNRNSSSTVEFSSDNSSQISWTAGDLSVVGEDSYTIDSGSYTNTSTAVCYFEPGESETELQFSTDLSEGIGENKQAIGYFYPGENKGAQFVPISFAGGIRFSGERNILAESIVTDQLAANSVTAEKADINELSAITADLGTVTTGTLKGVDIISTDDGNDRIEISSGDEIKLYADGDLKATIRGTVRGDGGVSFEEKSNIFTENDSGFLVASESGERDEFGGFYIDSNDRFQLIAGVDNYFNIRKQDVEGGGSMLVVREHDSGFNLTTGDFFEATDRLKVPTGSNKYEEN